MLIRFLETTESERPGLPFQAGQIINVATPTPEMLGWLRSSRAVVIKQDVDEIADAPEPVEAAVTHERRKYTKRHAS